jgi:hypothetical protein
MSAPETSGMVGGWHEDTDVSDLAGENQYKTQDRRQLVFNRRAGRYRQLTKQHLT